MGTRVRVVRRLAWSMFTHGVVVVGVGEVEWRVMRRTKAFRWGRRKVEFEDTRFRQSLRWASATDRDDHRSTSDEDDLEADVGEDGGDDDDDEDFFGGVKGSILKMRWTRVPCFLGSPVTMARLLWRGCEQRAKQAAKEGVFMALERKV